MAYWIANANLSPQEETRMLSGGILPMPEGAGLPDLSHLSSGEITKALKERSPDHPPETLRRQGDLIRRYTDEMLLDDTVVAYLPSRRSLAVGTVLSGYLYESTLPDALQHHRKVMWEEGNILPVSAFPARARGPFSMVPALGHVYERESIDLIRRLFRLRSRQDKRRLVAKTLLGALLLVNLVLLLMRSFNIGF